MSRPGRGSGAMTPSWPARLPMCYAAWAGSIRTNWPRCSRPGSIRAAELRRAGLPPWHAGAAQFGGRGSHGNGGAMRVAPLGAYYFGNPARAAAEAAAQAEVTHANIEGIAGAVAVAVAASTPQTGRALFDAVLDLTPGTYVPKACAGRGR